MFVSCLFRKSFVDSRKAHTQYVPDSSGLSHQDFSHKVYKCAVVRVNNLTDVQRKSRTNRFRCYRILVKTLEDLKMKRATERQSKAGEGSGELKSKQVNPSSESKKSRPKVHLRSKYAPKTRKEWRGTRRPAPRNLWPTLSGWTSCGLHFSINCACARRVPGRTATCHSSECLTYSNFKKFPIFKIPRRRFEDGYSTFTSIPASNSQPFFGNSQASSPKLRRDDLRQSHLSRPPSSPRQVYPLFSKSKLKELMRKQIKAAKKKVGSRKESGHLISETSIIPNARFNSTSLPDFTISTQRTDINVRQMPLLTSTVTSQEASFDQINAAASVAVSYGAQTRPDMYETGFVQQNIPPFLEVCGEQEVVQYHGRGPLGNIIQANVAPFCNIPEHWHYQATPTGIEYQFQHDSSSLVCNPDWTQSKVMSTDEIGFDLLGGKHCWNRDYGTEKIGEVNASQGVIFPASEQTFARQTANADRLDPSCMLESLSSVLPYITNQDQYCDNAEFDGQVEEIHIVEDEIQGDLLGECESADFVVQECDTISPAPPVSSNRNRTMELNMISVPEACERDTHVSESQDVEMDTAECEVLISSDVGWKRPTVAKDSWERTVTLVAEPSSTAVKSTITPDCEPQQQPGGSYVNSICEKQGDAKLVKTKALEILCILEDEGEGPLEVLNALCRFLNWEPPVFQIIVSSYDDGRPSSYVCRIVIRETLFGPYNSQPNHIAAKVETAQKCIEAWKVDVLNYLRYVK